MSAYGALREVGLEDAALDRFSIENASPTEMHQAAYLLAQLARSESESRTGARQRSRMDATTVRKQREGALATATILGAGALLFSVVFLYRATMALDEGDGFAAAFFGAVGLIAVALLVYVVRAGWLFLGGYETRLLRAKGRARRGRGTDSGGSHGHEHGPLSGVSHNGSD